jgi:dTDP-4-dehydrorhamnose reductase
VKRVLITGSNGLLGQKLAELLLCGSDYDLMLTSVESSSIIEGDDIQYRQLDITNRSDVRRVVDDFHPDVIVNTAAITNVDQCETERQLAWNVNVIGVENLVIAAKFVGAKVIQFSTDYIFDGKAGPYDEEARPNPMSYYGRTKLASENVLRTHEIPFAIIRTMVLYGVAPMVKLNFALWLVHELERGKPVRVVDDQYGNPTLADDLAYGVLKIIVLDRRGVYNIAGADYVSRYEFALALAKQFGIDKKLITPIKTAILKQPAPRPMRSGFIILKAETDLGIKMSGVEHGLTVIKNQLSLIGKKSGEPAASPQKQH